MERIEFDLDLLFRWFVGIGIDDAVWDHSSFTKNRDRLLEGEITAKFLSAALSQPRVRRLLLGFSTRLRFALAIIRGAGGRVIAAINRPA
jgi:Transposase domain (DUF772)